MAGSIPDGHWRYGFITRFLVHCPVDIVLYSAKSFEYFYRVRFQRAHDCVMSMTMFAVWLSWIIFKCIIYCWLCIVCVLYWHHGGLSEEPVLDNKMALGLSFGTWAMWLLQVVWGIKITQITVTSLFGGKLH